MVLLRHLEDTDDWDLASRCWHAELFQPMMVIYYKPGYFKSEDHAYYVVLGCLMYEVVVCWKVEPVGTPSPITGPLHLASQRS